MTTPGNPGEVIRSLALCLPGWGVGGGVDSSTIVGYPTSSAPAPYKGATNGREFYADGDGGEGKSSVLVF